MQRLCSWEAEARFRPWRMWEVCSACRPARGEADPMLNWCGCVTVASPTCGEGTDGSVVGAWVCRTGDEEREFGAEVADAGRRPGRRA